MAERTTDFRRIESVAGDRRTRRDWLEAARGSSLFMLFAAGSVGCDPPRESRRTGAAGKDGLEPALRLACRQESIDPRVIADFERRSGVAVACETYVSDVELETMLLAAEDGCDACICGSGPATRWIAADLLAPLDRARLSNFANLAPEFLAPPWDPANRFTVPFAWGMTGIAFRTDKVEIPPRDLSVFFDARYRKKMTMLADPREVLGAMLQRRGDSRNCRDAARLEIAKADAIAARKNLRALVPTAPKAHLLAGEVWVAQLGNGDAARLREEDPAIEWILPKEGGRLWQDSFVVPRRARNPAAAHAFLDFAMRADAAAALAEYSYRGTPNRAAMASRRLPLPLPTADERQRLEYDLDLGRDAALWDRIWSEVEAAV